MAVELIDFSATEFVSEHQSIQAIPLAQISVTAFIGRTERGPLNEPVEIRSFAEYRRVFGGHCKFSFVSHTVQHYFLHGGQLAVVVRLSNRASRAAIDIPAGDEFLHLQARHPGRHEYLRVSIDYDQLDPASEQFNLVIQRVQSAHSQLIEDQELYPSLSMNQADARFIVDKLQNSRIVRVSGPLPRSRPDPTPASCPGAPIPYIALSAPGADGQELTDYDVIGSNNEGTGLFALDRAQQVDLLCVPPAPKADIGITTFLAAERYCERRRAILVWDPPWAWDSPDAAILGVRHSMYASQNALTYFPRIRERGDAQHFESGVPACGAICGMLAQQDAAGDWGASSETANVLKTSLTPLNFLDANSVAMLRRFGVNVLTNTRASRAAFRGNVTLAGSSAVSSLWQKLDKRRLLFFILNSIERTTHWVPQRLDDAETARNLEFQIMAFLFVLLKQGALAGKTPNQAFSISILPPSKERSGLWLRISIALQRPHDYLTFEFVFEADGCTIRSVSGQEVEQLIG